jgi:hypothetical protein
VTDISAQFSPRQLRNQDTELMVIAADEPKAVYQDQVDAYLADMAAAVPAPKTPTQEDEQ